VLEYPSTLNLYASNGAQDGTRVSGPEYGFRLPAVGQIAKWLVTEKVDGMNMRVVWHPFGVSDDPGPPFLRIYGRTDRAQIPGDLMSHMQERFTHESLVSAFPQFEEWDGIDDAYRSSVVLFGEGFGPGIQKAGQAYGGSKRFALFDVVVDGHWLDWAGVEDVAAKLGIPTVPVLARGVSLEVAKEYVRSSQLQEQGSEHIEGIVARTDPYLFDGRGNRVMFKYKVRDLS
jgi:hypothetical protein